MPVLNAPAAGYTFTTIRFQLPNGARSGCRTTIIGPAGIPSTTFAGMLIQITS